jgi:hypothetical protein
MATLKEIRKRLRQLGLESEYGYRAEAKLIPGVLEADEELQRISSGVREGQRWILLLTPRRLLFLAKPTMGDHRSVALPREAIRRVDGKRGVFFARLEIESDAGTYRFTNVLKKSLASFLEGFDTRLR